MVMAYIFSIQSRWGTPPRVLFTLFETADFYWSSVFIVTGLITGTAVVAHLAEQQGDDPHFAWRGFAWMAVFGLLGARLFHTAYPPPSDLLLGIDSAADYWQNLSLLINIRQGGLHIVGGLLGGLLGWVTFSIRYRLPLLIWLDRMSLGTAVGLTVGYWSHFFNQSLYGLPSNHVWAWPIDSLYLLPQWGNTITFHPVFLYLSLWHFMIVILLYTLWYSRNFRPRRGDSLALFVLCFTLGQAAITPVQLNLPTRSLPIGVDWPVTIVWLFPIAGVVLVWHLWRLTRRKVSPS